jgi:acetylornithine deacetylase
MKNSAVEQSELWDISRQLIAFDTVSAHSNMGAAQYLASYLEESGFTVHLYKESYEDTQKAMVIAWAGPAVPDGLIISGHIDVVPFEGQPGWQTDPLTLTLSNDEQHIIGRGVSDMKIFLAQAILAARRQSAKNLKRPLVFIFTCDEELVGQGAERLIKVLPDYFQDFPLPKIALIGEPTNFEVYPAHKGYATVDIRLQGKGGHSSVPSYGLNAIAKMADVIHEIEQMNQQLQQQVTADNRKLFPESPATVFNCGLIHGGLAPNMIAETCYLTVSIRACPGDNVEGIVRTLQERLDHTPGQAMKAVSPECGIFVENFLAIPPMRSPAEGPFCDLLSRVMGKQLERGAAYSTDGGHFQLLGIVPYVCGPGLLAEAHQPNESLPVANFFAGQERLEALIHEWCMQ